MLELNEIRKLLQKDVITKYEWGDYQNTLFKTLAESKHSYEVEGHTFTREEQYGGEGKGDEYWVVFSVSKDDEKRFYKIPGWYSSGYGSELEPYNTFEVKPEQKTIIVWE